MQITSLTASPSKLARVPGIKVSFLFENTSRSGEPLTGRAGGRGGGPEAGARNALPRSWDGGGPRGWPP